MRAEEEHEAHVAKVDHTRNVHQVETKKSKVPFDKGNDMGAGVRRRLVLHFLITGRRQFLVRQ